MANYMKEELLMPIGLAPINVDMKVLADEKTKKHLESLGILPNSSIRVISSVNGGVVIAIKALLSLDLSIRRFIIFRLVNANAATVINQI